jgi:hypothetical protein
MNKPDVSVGRRDITVWAESAGRRLYKNRIFYLFIYLFFLFLEKNIIFRIKIYIFKLKTLFCRRKKIFFN